MPTPIQVIESLLKSYVDSVTCTHDCSFILYTYLGNMLRTDDGKLCILDFGLMTEITDDQKYGMIEAIAHLINRDYTEIGQDFKVCTIAECDFLGTLRVSLGDCSCQSTIES